MAASVSKGWVTNIVYDIDNGIPKDKRFSPKNNWSAYDNVIPEDKRWVADINEILEDKRWNYEQEIIDAFNASLKCSFPELKEEEAVLYDSRLGMPGDFNWYNVFFLLSFLSITYYSTFSFLFSSQPKCLDDLAFITEKP